MNLSVIGSSISKAVGRTGLVVQKYSPEILMIGGITGGIVAGALASKATLKASAIMAQHREEMKDINDCWDNVQDGTVSLDEYSKEDHRKDLITCHAITARQLFNEYWPSITLGIVSIASIIAGYGIMKKRNVAIMAAYKAVEEAFTKYRRRVVDEYGEETDYMFKNGFHKETVDEIIVDEKGKTKVVKKKKYIKDTNGLSMYAKCFDEGCRNWSPSSEYNLMFLRSQQNYFNNILQIRKHVFLNEVYNALGFPHTQAGATVGWALNADGDNFVDFGIFDGDKPRARDFVNGYERSIWLDFNVDGVIWDLI